jgi:hypothetical protein
MSTPAANQEKEVASILRLFGEVEPEDFKDLRTTIDSAVHFYYFLRERIAVPIDITSPDIDYVLNTVTAYAEFFWYVRGATSCLLPGRRQSFKWLQFRDLNEMKKQYFSSYRKLASKSTTKIERYKHLLRLTQIQLIFAGIVF